MRTRTLSNVLTYVAVGSLVTATPTAHRHHRHAEHIEARAPENFKTVNVVGPTTVAYELNGQSMTEDQVCEGIRDGTLKWAVGTERQQACFAHDEAIAQTTPTFSAAALIASSPPETENPILHTAQSSNAHKATKTSKFFATQTISPIFDPNALPATAPSKEALPLSDQSDKKGIYDEFPDGLIDCSDFPSDYGPMEVEWAGLGGWTGIQYVKETGNRITHIDTAVPGGAGCKPGAMCSYACPPGYQKSQWPSAQGATGQSVGGLRCKMDGKLSLTNPTLSKKLCIPGTGATVVQNKLSENAAICRTDYPGTENEVVPLNTQPQSTNPLTCPDAGTYFKHEGSSTTAQYYINNQGVPVNKACIWGADGTNMGNWAPSYLGVGQDIFGKTFLAIASTIQNKPTNYKPLNYTVEITGDISGKCRLKNGKYCSGEYYDKCNEKGCTVQLLSGHATYVLSD